MRRDECRGHLEAPERKGRRMREEAGEGGRRKTGLDTDRLRRNRTANTMINITATPTAATNKIVYVGGWCPGKEKQA